MPKIKSKKTINSWRAFKAAAKKQPELVEEIPFTPQNALAVLVDTWCQLARTKNYRMPPELMTADEEARWGVRDWKYDCNDGMYTPMMSDELFAFQRMMQDRAIAYYGSEQDLQDYRKSHAKYDAWRSKERQEIGLGQATAPPKPKSP